MKKLYSMLSLITSILAFSQINKDIKEGILITTTNESIAVKDLKWDKNGKAYFLNASNKQLEELYENSIKSLEAVSTDDSRFIAITHEKPLSQDNKKNIADNLYRPSYEEGIYVTKQDFINKVPTQKKSLTKKGLQGFEKPVVDDEENICFFFDENDSKLKNVFAVVYNGILYFNVKAILNNRNKNDNAQDSDNPNSFARVSMGGDNYQYTEINIGNVWAKGLASQSGVVAVIGSSKSTYPTNSYDSMQAMNSYKGVVWDYANKEFNIFKNCKDYNDFIKDRSPADIQECKQQQPDKQKVRLAMEKIK